MKTKEEIQADLTFRRGGIKYTLALFMICTIGLKFYPYDSTDIEPVNSFLTGMILTALIYGYLILWKIPSLEKELSKYD